MKTIVISIRNQLFAQGLGLALDKTGRFQHYRAADNMPQSIMGECFAHRTELLLMDVAPAEEGSLPSRLAIAEEVRELIPELKVALLCDEVAYPELAREIMHAKRNGSIDAFYYASVPMDYLIDTLDAL